MTRSWCVLPLLAATTFACASSSDSVEGAGAEGSGATGGVVGGAGVGAGGGVAGAGGAGGTGAATPPRCGGSTATSLLDFVAVGDDIAEYNHTDSSKPDTAEVYCTTPDGNITQPPIVLVPGLGLSHYMYLTTPDGRPGFASLLAQAGHPVFTLNPSANRASAADTSEGPGLQRWGPEMFWSRWGFGPENGVPHDDVRFPVADIEHFIEHMPLWGGSAASSEDELEQLLEWSGPAVVVVHSAAGEDAFPLALRRPELMRALVVLEPVGCPSVGEPVPDVPLLAVYGDYIKPRGQSSRLAACGDAVAAARELGLAAELISYPDRGVHGNTHLMTQDNNNATIVGDILAWLP